jgi:haloalkane dehalogenase
MSLSESAPWRELFPFPSHYLQMPYGLRMHYVDEPSDPSSGHGKHGTGPNAPCVVAVHGNPTWSFTYRELIAAMRGTHRVLAVDHIGCGLSSKPQRYEYCLKTHTDNLVHWIEALDLKDIVMVVHDWGGAIGLGAAIQCIDRMAGIVVLNTGAFPPPHIPLRIAACRLPFVGSWSIRYGNLFAQAATRMALNRKHHLPEKVAQGLLAPYDSPMNRIGIDTFVRDIPFSPLHRTYGVLQHLELQLSTLRSLPIRLVWGMKDWCFRPECLQRFQGIWPEAKIRKLDDVGHYVMEEAADEVIAEVRELVRDLQP